MDLINVLAEVYGVKEEDLFRRWDRVLSERERRAFFSKWATTTDRARTEEFLQKGFAHILAEGSELTIRRIVHRLGHNFESNLEGLQEIA